MDHQRNKYNRSYQTSSPKPRFLSLGTRVWINVSHPLKRELVYLCEARVIRTPRWKGETKYKLVVTAARTFSEKEKPFMLEKLIGMKVVRDVTSVQTDEPWMISSQRVPSISMSEEEADLLVRISINRIRREQSRQQKHNNIKRLV